MFQIIVPNTCTVVNIPIMDKSIRVKGVQIDDNRGRTTSISHGPYPYGKLNCFTMTMSGEKALTIAHQFLGKERVTVYCTRTSRHPKPAKPKRYKGDGINLLRELTSL